VGGVEELDKRVVARSLGADIVENKRAAVRDRRYSAILSRLRGPRTGIAQGLTGHFGK